MINYIEQQLPVGKSKKKKHKSKNKSKAKDN